MIGAFHCSQFISGLLMMLLLLCYVLNVLGSCWVTVAVVNFVTSVTRLAVIDGFVCGASPWWNVGITEVPILSYILLAFNVQATNVKSVNEQYGQ